MARKFTDATRVDHQMRLLVILIPMLKSLLFPVLTFCALTQLAFAGAPNTLTGEETAAGWKLLFDGKTPAGWHSLANAQFPASGWDIEDGTLHHLKGDGGDIVTAAKYTNFELIWDWKIAEAGNSGVKYNLPDSQKNIGFEYQLLDDAKHPDGIHGGALHQTAGLYDLIPPAADKKVNPVGAWNQSRLLVDGNHIEHWINGVKTVEFEIGGDTLNAAIAKSKYKNVAKFGEKSASPILLQDHGDEIHFRSIKLRELPAK